MEYKIYFLKDPRTNEVRYVGKTTKDLNKRLFSGHLRDKTITHKTNWINSLKKIGLIPSIELVKICKNENLCCFSERFYIKLLGRADKNEGILINSTDGGEGTPGKVVSQATKDKISKSNAGKGIGRKVSETTKEKQRISYKNIPDEIKKQTSQKISKANLGNKKSIQAKLNMSKAQYERESPSQNTKDKISKTLLGFKNENTSSNYIGVSFIQSQNLYRATIRFNRNGVIIGHFKEEIHAAVAYNIKAFELYKNEAKLNNILNWQTIDITKKITSKYFGVSFKKKPQKWESSVYFNNKNNYIGSYKTELEAAEAYNKFIIKNNINKKINIL
jgi:hypothetical protein